MKILQINNVYAEKSTGKITRDLHQGLLAAGMDSMVVYGRGKGAVEPGVIRLCPDWYGKLNALCSRITGIPYGGCLLATWRLQRIIRREKPDVVHLQCLNGNFVNIYRLVWWLKTHKIRTVCSLHAEFMYTANCGHAFDCDQWQHGCQKCPDKYKAVKSWLFDRTAASWRKMKAAFDGFEEFCCICPVSPWTQDRAMQADILKGFSFQTVYNGVDTDIFHLRSVQKEANTVLNVTACHNNEKGQAKGGWYLEELARIMPDVTFLVAGRAQRSGVLPGNVTLLGEIRNHDRLATLYGQASVSVLVSQKETFSMPCAESLCCGTPVVGFCAGAPEQISLPAYSEFVEQGNTEKLAQVIRFWLNREDLDAAKIAEDAHRTYSVETMVDKFIEIYRSM